jgi:hypothetical protein
MHQKIVHGDLAESFAIGFVAQGTTFAMDSVDLFIHTLQGLMDLRHGGTRLIALPSAQLQ